MGLWVTGYLDTIHDGLSQGMPEPESILPVCDRCGIELDSMVELRQHLFEKHPSACPELLIAGRPAARQGEVIRSRAFFETIIVSHAGTAILDGRQVAPEELAVLLAEAGNGRHKITLAYDSILSEYTIDTDIANPAVIRSVDDALMKFLDGQELCVSSIADFTQSSLEATGPSSYLSGLVEYLFGVLAKDGRGKTELSREVYTDRFNRAAHSLAGHSSLPARAIRTVVAFDQNDFSGRSMVPDVALLARACGFYAEMIAGRRPRVPELPQAMGDTGFRLPIDAGNGNLIRLAYHQPRPGDEIIAGLADWLRSNDLLRNDRPKAKMLLGFWRSNTGDTEGTRGALRGLVNDPVFGAGAMALLD